MKLLVTLLLLLAVLVSVSAAQTTGGPMPSSTNLPTELNDYITKSERDVFIEQVKTHSQEATKYADSNWSWYIVFTIAVLLLSIITASVPSITNLFQDPARSKKWATWLAIAASLSVALSSFANTTVNFSGRHAIYVKQSHSYLRLYEMLISEKPISRTYLLDQLSAIRALDEFQTDTATPIKTK